MPAIYLSPSVQDWNAYVTGKGSEEYYMNRLADALEPYLLSNGIRYRRNDPDMTAAAAIRDANSGVQDFYLALHSNAAPEGQYGTKRGIIAFYYPGSLQGERAAELFVEELRQIYPLPELVTTRATTALGEVRQSRAPAVLLEIGFHDNREDALWVEHHTQLIARQIAMALTDYFGLPFIEPMKPEDGEVDVEYGTLNLRDYPSPEGAILANMPDDARVRIYGEWQGWYVVHYRDLVGYAAARYIDT